VLNQFRLLIGATEILVICLPNQARAYDGAVDQTKSAMKQCELGRLAPDRPARLGHFEQGGLLAEQAVAGNQQSADAHFSLVCNLGEIMRIDGEASLASMLGFRRMMKELDRTLEPGPNHLDALSAKGTLLVRLPPFLGGEAIALAAEALHLAERHHRDDFPSRNPVRPFPTASARGKAN
jgi:hypothetical protein